MQLSKLLRKAVTMEPKEVRATLVSFSFVFVLMAAYYILRPVRDAMASDWTDAEVSWLWTINFFISALAVSLYGGAVTSVKFRNLVTSVYAGASTGALAGPFIPAFFADSIGTDNLILLATLLLLVTIPIISILQRLKASDLHNEELQVGNEDFEYIGGNPLWARLYPGLGSRTYFRWHAGSSRGALRRCSSWSANHQAGRQLRHYPTRPRNAVYLRQPGNPLQGQTGHRYRGLPWR
jgi:hypothetical protein